VNNVEENIYYSVLDNWYVAKYANLQTQDLDKIISNLESLLTEVKAWRDENVAFAIREETVWKPYGLVFYTYDQDQAKRVFLNGYRTSRRESFLKESYDDLAPINEQEAENEKLGTVEGEKLDDSLYDALIGKDEPETKEATPSGEEPGDLPEELFDDLAVIGLSTAEREAIPEEERELLPEELFDDLAAEEAEKEKRKKEKEKEKEKEEEEKEN
jgi:hypothetical protein